MERPGISRRELLRRGAAGGAALALGPSVFALRGREAPTAPRIVIVGAGLAGLSCAYRLERAGSPARSTRPTPSGSAAAAGPRATGPAGQTAEHGGEFIDSRHRRHARAGEALRARAHRPLRRAQPGQPAAVAERRAAAALGAAAPSGGVPAPDRACGAPGRRLLAADHTAAAVAFDQLSVKDWLDQNLPGGSAGLWGQYVWAEMASEFGLDATGSAPSTSSTSTSRPPRAPTSATTSAAATTRSRRRSPTLSPRARSTSTLRSRPCSSAPTAATGCASAAAPTRWSPTRSCSRSRSPPCAGSTSPAPG